MRTIAVCLIFVTAFFLSPLVAFSTEDVESAENASMALSGQVVSVDTENQQIVVEYQSDELGALTSALFYFSDTMEIYKDGAEVQASELKEGDKVFVTYQIDDNGGKVILKLTLNN